MEKDVVIIGAGASGLMCAIEAGRRGRSVAVLDHAGKIANKVRVSGGGRCNFTNLDVRADHYFSENPHFCKSALARYTPKDFLAVLKAYRIAYSEREDGQLFCVRSAGEIVEMLHEQCDKAGVVIMLNHEVESIAKPEQFEIFAKDKRLQAQSLVIATGGLSWPQLGATDFGLRIARQFRLKIVQPRPALVPLLFSRKDAATFACLSGISFQAVVRSGKKQFRGAVLFTHRGLSGPAMLQISTCWQKDKGILIDLLPDEDAYAVLKSAHQGKIELQDLLTPYLSKRFSSVWCSVCVPSRPMNTYSEKELKAIAERLHAWTIIPSGTEGYKKAEVTAGGVDTDELSSKTMEAKKVPGLYFIGEVVDVTGQLGGYNLQWAWSSGWVAGQMV